MTFRRMFFVLTSTLAVVATFATNLAAQAERSSRSLIVAIVESLPIADAKAVVIRSAASGKEDVIIMKQSEATALTLAMALERLAGWRAAKAVKGEQQILAVTGIRSYDRQLPVLEKKFAPLMRRLARQPTAQIGNAGRGKWIRLSDPASIDR